MSDSAPTAPIRIPLSRRNVTQLQALDAEIARAQRDRNSLLTGLFQNAPDTEGKESWLLALDLAPTDGLTPAVVVTPPPPKPPE